VENRYPLTVGVTDIAEVGGNGFLTPVAANAGDEAAIDMMHAVVRVRKVLGKKYPSIKVNFEHPMLTNTIFQLQM
jgi:hypothetical protein